jgi:hypothetical protein
VAARLIAIATSKKTEPRDAIVAAREVLDRAGLVAERPVDATSAGNGTVLWDEFCAIYQRRVVAPSTPQTLPLELECEDDDTRQVELFER